jgi:hypothetical protein
MMWIMGVVGGFITVIVGLQGANQSLRQKNMDLKLDHIAEATKKNSHTATELWREVDSIKDNYIDHEEHERLCTARLRDA